MIIKVKNYSEGLKILRSTRYSKFKVNLSIDREKGLRKDLVLLSSGGRTTVIRYLIGKLLWDELTNKEKELLYSLPESLKFPYFQILKSLNNTEKSLVRKRYNSIAYIFKLKEITRQQYLSIKGQCLILLYEEERILPKVTKFSGYVKSHKDHGTLGEEREYLSEEFSPVIDLESILYSFLTVGEFPFKEILLPDDGPKSPKR
jgi:hypothetical protein